jgi:hypothetical protein
MLFEMHSKQRSVPDNDNNNNPKKQPQTLVANHANPIASASARDHFEDAQFRSYSSNLAFVIDCMHSEHRRAGCCRASYAANTRGEGERRDGRWMDGRAGRLEMERASAAARQGDSARAATAKAAVRKMEDRTRDSLIIVIVVEIFEFQEETLLEEETGAEAESRGRESW